MAVLVVLIVTFFIALAGGRLAWGEWTYAQAGNIAMCVMLLFTAIGHFKFAKGMEMMIPRFIPFRRALVFVTGIMEILAGLALLFPSYRYTAGIFLIVFFILILPANIHAALHKVDYQKGTLEGPGAAYLWFRIPMQLFLIAWVWYFAVWL
ncbi:DoxX family protein [Dyadobacter sandarakinus]|uniref:DoxX-like family protein n=1 Tax=Dyadobacter sandarakinus TaxID=2747268 RepID=A0ABX7I3N9_9BACT|nr:hypothetical protein [Dyadobacter sandarakinus]QRR00415.1 hypothetical protein HWI92_05585 [Dyadobacter sandarakinus]